MCACEGDRTCLYHAQMRAGYQRMWSVLKSLADGKVPDEEPREIVRRLPYLTL